MNSIQIAFAGVARQFHVDWKSGEADVHGAERENLRANFAAIILNGLFFPTAGKILGAGLLLTWFLNELKPSALLVASLVPIQYGASLLAQPWIGQWMSTRSSRVRYYRN